MSSCWPRAAPQASQRCIRDAAAGKTDCSVIEQARAAFSATVARIFTPGTNPGLDLMLTVEGAEPFASVSGVQLEVQTRVRILSPGGELLDEIESLGAALLSAS